MRPLAIYSLGSYLTTLLGWAVVRARRQWKRLPGTPRGMAPQSRAFASGSHASTTSFRHTPRGASQTQSTGDYPNGLLGFASPFKWEIFEGCSATATEAASCVVRLANAEKQGVPLPAGWGPKVAALLDGSLQTKGTLMLRAHLARASGALFVKHVLCKQRVEVAALLDGSLQTKGTLRS